jgi:hypothetical protein
VKRISSTSPGFGTVLSQLRDAKHSLGSSPCLSQNVRSPIFRRPIRDVGVKD